MVPVGVLETLKETLCKVYDCLTTKLYIQKQYEIKLRKKIIMNLKNHCCSVTW